MNTLSAKADSFFGEPDHCRACTQRARSGLGLSVERHLTTKFSPILGDPERELSATISSDPSDLLSKFYPPRDIRWNRILLKEPSNNNTFDMNLISAIPPSAKADGPLAS